MLRPGNLGQADDGPPKMQAKARRAALEKAKKDARIRVLAQKRKASSVPAPKEIEEVEGEFSFKSSNRGRITSQDLRKKPVKIVDRSQGPVEEKSQDQKVADEVRKKTEGKRLKQAMAITAHPEADEITKHKIEKIKKRIHRLRGVQAVKRKKQLEKWGSRPDVLRRWRERDEVKKASHDRKLASWVEKDEKEAARQAKEMEKIKVLPDFAERKARLEAQWARRDARVKSARAHQEAIFAEQEARHVKIRELGQRRRDQMYNFVGQFLGWPQRPLITPTSD